MLTRKNTSANTAPAPNMTDAQAKRLQAGQKLNYDEAQDRKTAFLAALAPIWPNTGKACKATGIPRGTVERWKVEDKDFAAKVEQIKNDTLDELEQTILLASKDRGGAGYAIPILRAYRRNIYGDKVEHSGSIAQVTLSLPGTDSALPTTKAVKAHAIVTDIPDK